MMLIQGAIPAACGALAGAVLCERIVSSLLFGVSAVDWPTYALVLVIQLLVALAATYLPARRAAGIDPWKALRYE